MRRARLARHRRVGTTARLLKSVPLLSALPERALTALAADAPLRTVPAGSRVIAELEPGEEALIVLRGVGKATVGGVGGGEPVEIGSILPGDCMGEMALFTGELRSATVTAETAMTLLVVDRLRFDELLHGYPAIAGHLARVLGTRLRESDRLLTAVLDPASSDAERRHALRGLAGGESDRHNRRLTTAMWVAWQELVARHRQELPFLMLLAFAITLVAVRSAVLVQRSILPQVLALETLLRASYVSGLLLLCASGTASLLFFRQRARRRGGDPLRGRHGAALQCASRAPHLRPLLPRHGDTRPADELLCRRLVRARRGRERLRACGHPALSGGLPAALLPAGAVDRRSPADPVATASAVGATLRLTHGRARANSSTSTVRDANANPMLRMSKFRRRSFATPPLLANAVFDAAHAQQCEAFPGP